MTTKFEASYEGIGQMLCMTSLQQNMRRRAERVKTAAIPLSPYDEDEEGQHYVECFEVSSGVKVSEKGAMRAYGRVTNTSPHASAVEWGFNNTPRHRVLGRAMMAAGD